MLSPSTTSAACRVIRSVGRSRHASTLAVSRFGAGCWQPAIVGSLSSTSSSTTSSSSSSSSPSPSFSWFGAAVAATAALGAAWASTSSSDGDDGPAFVACMGSQVPSSTKLPWDAVIKRLRDELGEDKVCVDQDVLAEYGKDKFSYHSGPPPNVVVSPESTEDVRRVVDVCRENGCPLIPVGSGTSLEGHTSAPNQGVCLSFENMTSVVAIRDGDMDVTVQPGITWEDLNAILKPYGLFYPVDPGPGASIGGMVGTGCSGTNAVRYGTMKQNVLNLTVVLADGSVVKTSQRARKSVAGYDLTSLIVGSEGTLGVVTEITLKLSPLPEETGVASCSFASVYDASAACRAIVRKGVQVRCVELLDDVMIRAVNKNSALDLPDAPHLFFKFAGTKEQVEHDAKQAQILAAANGGGKFVWTSDPEEQEKIWCARKVALWACSELNPDAQVLVTDMCVPISKFPDAIAATQADIVDSGLVAPIVGHVGDGNYHVLVLFDPNNPEEVMRAKALNECMVHRAISLDGTCTGEHGVGVGKKHFLEEELGKPAVAMMRSIKSALDPTNIMNPGKVLPDPSSAPAEAEGRSAHA